ncbi:MAG: LemA family protein, partial [Armatimonadetes bacterium]|nr:LemA family protein [Armatimonadota bacterium]
RKDLIGQLISLAQTAGRQEKELIDALKRLTQSDQNPSATDAEVQAKARELLSRLEQNPGALSHDLLVRISDEITGAENRVAVERKRYNEAIHSYNSAARSLLISPFRMVLGYPARLEPAAGTSGAGGSSAP